MKIELKHYAPYLGCDAKDSTGKIGVMVGLSLSNDTVKMYYPAHNDKESWFPFENCKLILRPLSDLTKKIETHGEKFVPIIAMYPLFHKQLPNVEMICNQEVGYAESHYYGGQTLKIDTKYPLENRYDVLEKLFKWHFDVFGLIPSGLALPKK